MCYSDNLRIPTWAFGNFPFETLSLDIQWLKLHSGCVEERIATPGSEGILQHSGLTWKIVVLKVKLNLQCGSFNSITGCSLGWHVMLLGCFCLFYCYWQIVAKLPHVSHMVMDLTPKFCQTQFKLQFWLDWASLVFSSLPATRNSFNITLNVNQSI
jgi:hypothetical protein